MEKFQTLQPRKVALFIGTFLILMVFIFQACQRDNNIAINPVSISEAQEWFNNYSSTHSLASSPNTSLRAIQPLWDKAFLVNNGVEIPLLFDNQAPRFKLKNGAEAKGRQRLLLVHTNSGYKPYFMTYIPKDDYQGQMQYINSENFLKNKFSGLVNVQDFDNLNEIRLLDVFNGNITKQRNGFFRNHTDVVSNRTICVEEVQTCVSWYQYSSTSSEIWGYQYLDETCSTVCVTWADDNPIYNNPDNNMGSGMPWNSDLNGGGSSSSSNTSTNTNTTNTNTTITEDKMLCEGTFRCSPWIGTCRPESGATINGITPTVYKIGVQPFLATLTPNSTYPTLYLQTNVSWELPTGATNPIINGSQNQLAPIIWQSIQAALNIVRSDINAGRYAPNSVQYETRFEDAFYTNFNNNAQRLNQQLGYTLKGQAKFSSTNDSGYEYRASNAGCAW